MLSLLTKNTTHVNTTTQTLTQEEKVNVEIMKRIMSEKKTTVPSLRNQDWRLVKSGTEKVNDLLTNIPTNNITELNDLFLYHTFPPHFFFKLIFT